MSAVKTFLAAALLAASFAGVAYARDEVFTAKLAAPVAAQTQVIALNTLWRCDGDTCLARPTHGANVRSCRQFVHQVGTQVTAYGSAERQLTADELARCNGEAPTQSAQN
jgi:hypothetical protein